MNPDGIGFVNRYTSKTKRGECANEDCQNARRHGSAYCQECSDRHNNRKSEKDSVKKKVKGKH